MKVAIRSDKFFNNQDKMEMYFGEVQPVDLNAGLVVLKKDKYGMDKAVGEEVENNIEERFGLQEPNERGGE